MGVIPSDLINIQATGHKIFKNGCRAPSTTYPPPLSSHQWLETYDIKTKMLVCTTLIQTSIFYPSLWPHLRDFTDLLAGRIPSRARYLKLEEFLCSFLCLIFAVVHHWYTGLQLTGIATTTHVSVTDVNVQLNHPDPVRTTALSGLNFAPVISDNINITQFVRFQN